MAGSQLNSKGFSLIEALVAIAITSMIAVVIGSGMSLSIRVSRTRDMRERATSLAREAMDIIAAHANDTNFFGCPACGAAPCTQCPIDSQKCYTPTNSQYTSCWRQFPNGFTTPPCSELTNECDPLRLKLDATNQWSFESGIETVGDFTRWIQLVNLCRNASNETMPCPSGINDFNTKKVTVNVEWKEKGNPKTVSITGLIAGWRKL